MAALLALAGCAAPYSGAEAVSSLSLSSREQAMAAEATVTKRPLRLPQPEAAGDGIALTPHMAELRDALLELSPTVDPQEAARAAEMAFTYSGALKRAYAVEHGPLWHNTLVNAGQKPRGLCWHWAQDMQARLEGAGFETLEVHRAIANSENIRLEHSTAILSAKGAPYTSGIVVDPWRNSGALFWAPVLEDARYVWRPRDEVLAQRRVEG